MVWTFCNHGSRLDLPPAESRRLNTAAVIDWGTDRLHVHALTGVTTCTTFNQETKHGAKFGATVAGATWTWSEKQVCVRVLCVSGATDLFGAIAGWTLGAINHSFSRWLFGKSSSERRKKKVDDFLFFFFSFLHLTGRELQGFDATPDLGFFAPCELEGI